MLFLLSVATLLGSLTPAVSQSTDCVVCVLALGLVQQLSNNITSNPDSDCKALGFCNGTCVFWNPWPANAAAFPTDGGVPDNRRSLASLPAASTLTREGALAFVRHSSQHLPRGSSFNDALTLLWRYIAEGGVAAAGGNSSHPCSDALDVVCDVERPFQYHIPMVDWDEDNFAGDPQAGDFLNQHFRGRSWRGKDCNDSSALIHPGALDAGGAVDMNCNGISGSEPASGTPYEQLYCSGDYAPMGIAIVGDSAAAHFHIPPQYMNAPTFNLSGLLEMAANEADWPSCSWATAYRNVSTECPRMGLMPSPPASFYQRWLDLNLCNHGDFQNIGVNGARTGSMAPPNGVINALARNPATDAPMLVIYALIGNDVCSSGADFTTVAEFQVNVLKSLDYLQATLPKGSHVAFLGLADGRVLYDTTHTRTHPLGMGYPDVYNFLSCNHCNPCWGWLNTVRAARRGGRRHAHSLSHTLSGSCSLTRSLPPLSTLCLPWRPQNETWRNATSERAAELTAVYDAIIAVNSTRYTAFDMYHLQVDWKAFISDYVAAGGDAFDLVRGRAAARSSKCAQRALS